MKIPEIFSTFRIEENSSTCSVSKVLYRFKSNPINSRESELLEGVVFGKCIEIWTKKEIFITLVNEEKTYYKGIDFFLCAKSDIKQHIAFQLLEYKLRYLGIKSSEDFADWVIKMKFNKGDKKIHLLVTLASNIEFQLNLKTLMDKFETSPFSSISLMGPTRISNNSDEFGHIIVGLNNSYFQTIIDLKSNKIIRVSGECPFFT